MSLQILFYQNRKRKKEGHFGKQNKGKDISTLQAASKDQK